MKKITDMRDAFIMKLYSLYDIEQELIEALPIMAEAAIDKSLKEDFRTHLEETRTQLQRLEQAFTILGVQAETVKNEGIRGIINDNEWIADCDAPEDVKDTMLAAGARSIEHYEMALYMNAQTEALALGQNEIAQLLAQTLSEEEVADEKLELVLTANL